MCSSNRPVPIKTKAQDPDKLVSILFARGEPAPGPKGRWFQIGTRHAIFQRMEETKIEKLARLSGRVASKVLGALERRGYDIGGKMSAPIWRGRRRAPLPKPKSNDSDSLGRLMPSRPGEFHPEPLTDPDLTLSRHPARATERRLPPPVENWSSSCCQLAHSQRR